MSSSQDSGLELNVFSNLIIINYFILWFSFVHNYSNTVTMRVGSGRKKLSQSQPEWTISAHIWIVSKALHYEKALCLNICKCSHSGQGCLPKDKDLGTDAATWWQAFSIMRTGRQLINHGMRDTHGSISVLDLMYWTCDPFLFGILPLV